MKTSAKRTDIGGTVERAAERTGAPRAARAFTHTPLFEGLARAGYAARGVVYGLVGVLAIRLAEGLGTRRPNQQGALRTIAEQPFGHLLLILVAIGLAGYAIWRLAQVLVGETPEQGKHSAADRVGALGSGIAYLGLAALAVAVLTGSSSSQSGSTSPKQTTAGVLDWPGGRLLVGAAGLVFLGIAAYQAYLGVSRKFLEYAKTGQMSAKVRTAYTWIGTVGLLARGVVFALIGAFVLKAAWDFRAKEAVGLDGALARLTDHAYGTTALLVVAAGLIAFGVYSLADARYRKI